MARDPELQQFAAATYLRLVGGQSETAHIQTTACTPCQHLTLVLHFVCEFSESRAGCGAAGRPPSPVPRPRPRPRPPSPVPVPVPRPRPRPPSPVPVPFPVPVPVPPSPPPSPPTTHWGPPPCGGGPQLWPRLVSRGLRDNHPVARRVEPVALAALDRYRLEDRAFIGVERRFAIFIEYGLLLARRHVLPGPRQRVEGDCLQPARVAGVGQRPEVLVRRDLVRQR